MNASYQHCAFGLRYLKANLGDLESDCEILEFTTKQDALFIIEKIIEYKPQIVGFGVYIWNTTAILNLIRQLKALAPEVKIVLGGPEISFDSHLQDHYQFCDYIVSGEGDFLFRELCEQLLRGQLVQDKIIKGSIPEIKQINLPYYLYSDEDIKNRFIYVEASRGCPYRCEYCLSSLDKSVRNFDVDVFLLEMFSLVRRGARNFKFVDRTFNLNPSICLKILNFFLEYIDLGLFLHFEMVPDRLPVEIRDLLKKFPAGSLQFEIGIQTWSPVVAANVSRRQNYEKIKENFLFLKSQTHIHTHADLIVGLPGETPESFAHGFDQLVACEPDEVQVGILKLLKGTPLNRHIENFSMVFSTAPPFQIIENKDFTPMQMQNFSNFAKFWDLLANRGNFNFTVKALKQDCHLTGQSCFNRFMDLSMFLFQRFQRSHSIPLLKLTEGLFEYLLQKLNWDKGIVVDLLRRDYGADSKRDIPFFLRSTDSRKKSFKPLRISATKTLNQRQLRHLSSETV